MKNRYGRVLLIVAIPVVTLATMTIMRQNGADRPTQPVHPSARLGGLALVIGLNAIFFGWLLRSRQSSAKTPRAVSTPPTDDALDYLRERKRALRRAGIGLLSIFLLLNAFVFGLKRFTRGTNPQHEVWRIPTITLVFVVMLVIAFISMRPLSRLAAKGIERELSESRDRANGA